MHNEPDRPLDPMRHRKMVLPTEDRLQEPFTRETELDLDNAWIRQSLGAMHREVKQLHSVIFRNQWWMLATIAVNTILVLVLAAMAWTANF